MEQPVLNPTIPFIAPVHGGKFVPGKMVKIQGSVPENAKRFNIHLQCGPNAAPRDDVAIRISVRFLEGHISLNSLQNTTWGREQRDAALPVKRGEQFKMILICDTTQYMVAINGQQCYEFPQRIPYSRISHLAIDGDINLSQISYELPSENGADTTTVATSPAKSKSKKSHRKNSSSKKTFSAQVHTDPLPDTDSGVPRRLSYEAAIYGTEAAYGYQEVSIIPSGTPPRAKGTFKSSVVLSDISSYDSSPPRIVASVPPYPTNGPKGMPVPTREPSPVKVKPVLSSAKNGTDVVPVSPKNIKRPLDPPPAAPKSTTPPASVSIPIDTARPSVQPRVPYIGPMLGGFVAGKWLKISAVIHVRAVRFNIRMQCSGDIIMQHNVALQISFDLQHDKILLNSKQNGTWDDAQTVDGVTIKREERMELLIKCEEETYKIIVNGENCCEFTPKIASDTISHLIVDGDILLEQISFEAELASLEGSFSPVVFKYNEPPPSYNEVQLQAHAAYVPTFNGNSVVALNLPAYSSITLPPYSAYPGRPRMSMAGTETLIPVNGASLRFQLVSPSRKKCSIYVCLLVLLSVVVGASLLVKAR